MLLTIDGNNLEQYEPILESVVGGNFNDLTIPSGYLVRLQTMWCTMCRTRAGEDYKNLAQRYCRVDKDSYHSTYGRYWRSADMEEDSDVNQVSQRPIKARQMTWHDTRCGGCNKWLPLLTFREQQRSWKRSCDPSVFYGQTKYRNDAKHRPIFSFRCW